MPERCQIRDSVHNFIELGRKEVQIVGTPLFQRLRGIGQLAMAYLVYPGALHTRFDHTLGVFHVAGLMCRHLGLNADESEIVGLAALLHDLGHGPFSHVSETPLKRYADPDAISADQKKEKIHELITAHFIQNDPEIVGILGRNTCQTVVRLLARGHGRAALRSIVSGPLDADKQDYLLRDSRFCGVEYGSFDIFQLHRSLVLEGPKDEEEMMVDEDGVHAVEQYVLAKYYLTKNVYRHKVRLISDQMLVRAIILGIEVDEIESLRKLYSYDGTQEFFDYYARWNDHRLLACVDALSRPETYCERIFHRLQDRRLYKRIFSERMRDLQEPNAAATLLELDRKENDALRLRMEEQIAEKTREHLGQEVDPLEVIIHAFDISSVRSSSRNDEMSILVLTRRGPKPFEEASTLFESIDERYKEGFVEVYAPVTWETRAERSKAVRALDEPIREILLRENRAKAQGGP
jgi:HD superfamily phosphohydrolase